ncbi:hypothetical protein BGX31_003784, partial [Mortierella sp. GBA43]
MAQFSRLYRGVISDNTRNPIPLVTEGVDGFKHHTAVFGSTLLHVNEGQVVTSMNHSQKLNRTKNKDRTVCHTEKNLG